MRFLVPQFIEIEDKLFGPLTFKQFVYMIGSLGFAGALFALYGTVVAIVVGGPIVAIGLALAFYRVNDRPSILVFQAILNYIIKRKLYLWKKQAQKQQAEAAGEMAQPALKPYASHVSESRLKELAWSLDIKESLNEESHPSFQNSTTIQHT